ncbi:MAG: hypothetical protein ABI606_12535 [Rhodoferax sp.]
MNTREQRLQMADVHMRDAMKGVISNETRASAAFDAGYTWLLVALDAPTGQAHPGVEAIQSAISRLGVSPEKMAIADEYLNRRYAPEGSGDLLAGLLDWAQEMQVQAGVS